jgi:diguanylate cyclase (GGDEF)-like protein
MKGAFCSVVSKAIRHLAYQSSVVHTVQQMLNDLKSALNVDYSVFLELSSTGRTLEIRHYCDLFRETVLAFQRPVAGTLFRILHLDPYLEVTPESDPVAYADCRLQGEYSRVVAIRVGVNNRAVGCFLLFFRQPTIIEPATREFLTSLSLLAGEAFAKDLMKSEVASLRRHEQQTGLLTYSYFLQKLREETGKCERYNIPLTIAVMEIDNLREVADLYGEHVARDLFVELADRLKVCVRGIDVMGHYGTNEIILFLPHTTLENAGIVIQRFREVMESSIFTSQGLGASLALGITQFRPGIPLERMVSRSQAAMHTARATGKGPLKYASLNS